MNEKKMPPIHPGEILKCDLMEPVGLNQNKLAQDLHIPVRRVKDIILGKRSINADTALRLARYFKTSPQFWLGLQMDYDLDIAEDEVEEQIKREIHPLNALG